MKELNHVPQGICRFSKSNHYNNLFAKDMWEVFYNIQASVVILTKILISTLTINSI